MKLIVLMTYLSLPALALGIAVKKRVLTGICETLYENESYECLVNIGESVVFKSLGPACPVEFSFQLESKDRETYLLQPAQTQTPGNERVETLIKNLFAVPSDQRSAIYNELRSICQSKSGSSADRNSSGTR